VNAAIRHDVTLFELTNGLQHPEHNERHRKLRAALLVGVVAWPAFALMDLWVGFVVDPSVVLANILMWRAIGTALIFAYWFRVRRSTRYTTLLELVTFQTCGILISLMALDHGGLNSPYLSGITVVVVVHAFTMTSQWKRAIMLTSSTALTFPAVLGASVLWRSDVREQWAQLTSLAEFVQDFLFLYSVVIVGSIISHQLWAAQRQVYEARKIGRYRLRKQVGAGGMGQVWLARDEQEKRDVALKLLLLDKDITKNATMRARFEREARTMSKLSSPHTVRIYDVGSSEDAVWYIAMEHLEGQDLRSYVKHGGPLDTATATAILLQLCESLSEAHQHGIIHRDVKPSNIFVTERADGAVHVTLLDFGIARSVYEDKTELTQGIIGTPGYIAPECFLGMPPADVTDVYSLGGVGYFMMSGKSPGPISRSAPTGATNVDGPRARREQHRFRVGRSADDLDLSAIPQPLASVIAKCLAPNPANRYYTVDDVAEALRVGEITKTRQATP
jgi:serine/threonine-protein kinase